MQAYHIPHRYVQWVQACVTSSRMTILINETADGFIQPTNGLRQGCALSPYLFILALDVLSRMLQFLVSKGTLTGVKIARGGPTITSLMYADDLLIFGEASHQEVAKLNEVLTLFCEISGQQIGAEKSRIWFSKSTPHEVRTHAISVFRAHLATSADVYLGAPISAVRSADFTPLLDKIDARLQPWKSALLSQAGKLVLLKSVIEPMLLYALQTAAIPTGLLRRIQQRVRAFFWNKGDDKRMPLVAWNTITTPKERGGLGLKDYVLFAKTVHMKNLWAVVSGGDSVWVKLVTAKYLSRSEIWSSSRTSRCTPIWRAMLAVREELRDSVKWELGDGRRCRAIGQPWHDLWDKFTPTNASQRKTNVADLLGNDGSGWDNAKLIQLFGFHGALYIALTFPEGPSFSGREDRLIFTAANNGKFTIKAAYEMLSFKGSTQATDVVYKEIWKLPHVLPKCKLFLWKVIRGAIPVDAVLLHRTGYTLGGCLVCGYHTEDLHHALFSCPRARQIWLTQLGLKSHTLPLSTRDAIILILQQLPTESVPIFVATLWEIWKSRCKLWFEGKYIKPANTIHAANWLVNTVQRATFVRTSNCCTSRSALEHCDYNCYTDGSWIHHHLGGSAWAYVIWYKGRLVQYSMGTIQSHSPFMAELQAMMEAVRAAIGLGITQCLFKSDCKVLQQVLSKEASIDTVEWRAYNKMMDLTTMYSGITGFKCAHIVREDNQLADMLAKFARTKEINVTDYTFPTGCIPDI